MKHFRTTTIIGSALLLWAGVASADPSSWGSGGATGTHAITATPKSADGTTSFHGHLVGSDTLNDLMDNLLIEMIADTTLSGSTTSGNEGYTVYDGLGSSVGQRWAEGSPSSGEPQCTPTDGNGGSEANPGCEEITPMSRPLNTAICDDDLDDGSGSGSAAAGAANHNYQAEGLAVCMDGVVVITDNHSLGEYGNSVGECDTFNFGAGGAPGQSDNTGNTFVDHGVGDMAVTGLIPGTSYTLGTNALTSGNAWKDALRLIYAGCTNASTGQGSGTCAGANDRVARCSAPERANLLASWHTVFPGTDCGAAGDSCAAGVRQVYRRDDGSGTTGSFLELIGIAKDPPNLLYRTTVTDGTSITALPNNLSFCDGGQVEGFLPTGLDGSGNQTFALGDPIRKTCAPEDDLCGPDGKAPVVRSIKSTISPDGDPTGAYPQYQCTNGLFSRKTYIPAASTLKLCPDGTKPNAAGCKFPYYTADGGVTKNFDCLSAKNNHPSTLPGSLDGRCYNFVMHLTNGQLRKSGTGTGASTMPEVASWRQNMAELNVSGTTGANAGFAFGSGGLGDFVCAEDDATRNIGCIVGHTTCTLGFAGRESAYSTSNTDYLLHEPTQLKAHGPSDTEVLATTYPLARKLWLNAIHGFENISKECTARGGTVNECADEVDIATEFFNYDGDPDSTTNHIAPLCAEVGFIPMPHTDSTPDLSLGEGPQCVGAMNGSATNGLCGAPDVQALTACEPH